MQLVADAAITITNFFLSLPVVQPYLLNNQARSDRCGSYKIYLKFFFFFQID